MPELPEVETSRRGVEPHLCNHKIIDIIVRNRQLRWPISPRLQKEALSSMVLAVRRRAKYLLIDTSQGCIILHLGMSGSLRMVDSQTPAEKHDHVDLVLSGGQSLRLRDPRRFGAVFWTKKDPLKHPRLCDLGKEPLEDDLTASWLFEQSRNRKRAIKSFIMDSKIIVGVGNIYACESLFIAGIHPDTAAGKLSLKRWDKLTHAIKTVLSKAIKQGGTTLKDFTRSDGQPGYFAQQLKVYGREGEPCKKCGKTLLKITRGQRSTFYCRQCQK